MTIIFTLSQSDIAESARTLQLAEHTRTIELKAVPEQKPASLTELKNELEFLKQ